MDRGRGRRVSPSPDGAILQLYGVREEIPPHSHRNLLQYPVSVPMHGLQGQSPRTARLLEGGNQRVETPSWKQTETESSDRK